MPTIGEIFVILLGFFELKSVRPAGRPLFITGDPTCGIFLKRGLFKGIKNDTPMCQMRKYINTNTQIHKYSI